MAVNKQSAPAQVETDANRTVGQSTCPTLKRSLLSTIRTDEFGPVSHPKNVRVFENVEPDEEGDHHDGDRVSQELIGDTN